MMLAGIWALSALSPAGARDDKDKAESPADELAQSIEQISLAERLVAYGRLKGDADALLLAAKILAANPVRKFPGKIEGDTATEHKADTPASLLAEAVKMQPDDKALAERAETLRKLVAGQRGGANGPFQVSGAVKAGGTWSGTKEFKPNTRCNVTFHVVRQYEKDKKGITVERVLRLNFTIYDSKGKVVAKDYGMDPILQWMAAAKGDDYKIVVQNPNAVAVSFTGHSN
jgi:hypothetical protein